MHISCSLLSQLLGGGGGGGSGGGGLLIPCGFVEWRECWVLLGLWLTAQCGVFYGSLASTKSWLADHALCNRWRCMFSKKNDSHEKGSLHIKTLSHIIFFLRLCIMSSLMSYLVVEISSRYINHNTFTSFTWIFIGLRV